MFDLTQFLKVVEELVFEFPTLVVMYGFWESKSKDKVIKQLSAAVLADLSRVAYA